MFWSELSNFRCFWLWYEMMMNCFMNAWFSLLLPAMLPTQQESCEARTVFIEHNPTFMQLHWIRKKFIIIHGDAIAFWAVATWHVVWTFDNLILGWKKKCLRKTRVCMNFVMLDIFLVPFRSNQIAWLTSKHARQSRGMALDGVTACVCVLCIEHRKTKNSFVSHKLDFYTINFVVQFSFSTRISMHTLSIFCFSLSVPLRWNSFLINVVVRIVSIFIIDLCKSENLCRQMMLFYSWSIFCNDKKNAAWLVGCFPLIFTDLYRNFKEPFHNISLKCQYQSVFLIITLELLRRISGRKAKKYVQLRSTLTIIIICVENLHR